MDTSAWPSLSRSLVMLTPRYFVHLVSWMTCSDRSYNVLCFSIFDSRCISCHLNSYYTSRLRLAFCWMWRGSAGHRYVTRSECNPKRCLVAHLSGQRLLMIGFHQRPHIIYGFSRRWIYIWSSLPQRWSFPNRWSWDDVEPFAKGEGCEVGLDLLVLISRRKIRSRISQARLSVNIWWPPTWCMTWLRMTCTKNLDVMHVRGELVCSFRWGGGVSYRIASVIQIKNLLSLLKTLTWNQLLKDTVSGFQLTIVLLEEKY